MMTYGALRKFIFLLLAVYFSIGLLAHYFSNGREDVYPFFSWFLYYKVPAYNATSFSIRVYQLGEERFEIPLYFEENDEIFDKTSYSTTQYHNFIRILAVGIKTNQKYDIDRLRAKLEENFLAYPVVYDVVEIKYNLIDRWKTGRLEEVRIIDTFTSDNR